MEGERKLVTVLFADVANFTALSEKLDPEEVHQIMDGCFQILMDEIHAYEGTINQFTGDGVMALFGAPLAHEDHAQRACHAALAIQKAIQDYSEKIQREYRLPFQLRIGLNSGPVVVGKIGDDLRMDYTAIGDTTNLASRMQSLAQPGTILVSSTPIGSPRTSLSFNPLGKIEVKGKEEPQEAYQLLSAHRRGDPDRGVRVQGPHPIHGPARTPWPPSWRPARRSTPAPARWWASWARPGVGKSRLLLEFRNRLPQEHPPTWRDAASNTEAPCLYLPILDILRSYFDLREGDREVLLQRKLKEKLILPG